MAERTFFGTLRIAVLLAILAFVAVGAWLDRTRARSWEHTLRITVYPLPIGRDAESRRYVEALTAADFNDVETFMRREAVRHGVPVDPPVRVRVSHAASRLPPVLPSRPGMFTIAIWSLRVRWYAARVEWNDPLPTPDIQVFATFAPLSQDGVALPDSVGLSKGLVAIANLYASKQAAGSNRVVLAHELLHTLGATDKYVPTTGQPIVPYGLGQPEQWPQYPQQYGEIMAGRIATGPATAMLPSGLREMRVGSLTAREIGWTR